MSPSAGSEAEGQIDNNSEKDCAENADQRAWGVSSDHCQQTGREGNNGNNNACLGDQLRLDFEDQFHWQRS
jgi:hypothetical protein